MEILAIYGLETNWILINIKHLIMDILKKIIT